jgi:hypothetical protein
MNDKSGTYPLLNVNEYLSLDGLDFNKFVIISELTNEVYKKILSDENVILIINPDDSFSYRYTRDVAEKLISGRINVRLSLNAIMIILPRTNFLCILQQI